MLFKLYLNWCILSRAQQYLGSRLYVQFVIILHSLNDKVKSRQISYILTEVYKRIPFCHGLIKIAEKNDRNINVAL